MMKKRRLTSRALVLSGAAALLGACASAPQVAPCKAYCTTQEEGYQWAQQANLLDARGCEGYAPGFAAGCRQAVSDADLSLNPRNAY